MHYGGIEHNEVKSSQISENEVVGSKDSSGTIIHLDINVVLVPDEWKLIIRKYNFRIINY